MSLASISTVNQGVSVNGAKNKNTLTQEDFLNIFVAQLQNQNPLEPLDNYQMASQMAQFNSLDSLHRIEKSLGALNNHQSSASSLQAAGLIGKKVEVSGRSLSLEKGQASEALYQMAGAGKVKIEIYNEGGQLIRTLDEGLKDTSKQKVLWDGKSEGGQTQPDGRYYFQVKAQDLSGTPIEVNHSRIGKVLGIYFENGQTIVDLGREKAAFGDILGILNSAI